MIAQKIQNLTLLHDFSTCQGKNFPNTLDWINIINTNTANNNNRVHFNKKGGKGQLTPTVGVNNSDDERITR